MLLLILLLLFPVAVSLRKIILAAIVKFSIKINESIRRRNLFVFMAIFTHTLSTIYY